MHSRISTAQIAPPAAPPTTADGIVLVVLSVDVEPIVEDIVVAARKYAPHTLNVPLNAMKLLSL